MFTAICKSDLKIEVVKEYLFHPTRKWRFDYAIPDHKIALEVEGGVWTGGRHTPPARVSQRHRKVQCRNIARLADIQSNARRLMQVEDAGIDKTGYFRLKTHFFAQKVIIIQSYWLILSKLTNSKDDKIFRIRIARPP